MGDGAGDGAGRAQLPGRGPVGYGLPGHRRFRRSQIVLHAQPFEPGGRTGRRGGAALRAARRRCDGDPAGRVAA